jgi:hypothetical protein
MLSAYVGELPDSTSDCTFCAAAASSFADSSAASAVGVAFFMVQVSMHERSLSVQACLSPAKKKAHPQKAGAPF